MQEFMFDVYALDMWWQAADECWEENNRHKIGKLSVSAEDFDSIDEKTILDAMAKFEVKPMFGIPYKAIPSTDRRKFFAEDYYGSGEWFEVGLRKKHEPIYGLMLCNNN